MVVISIKDKKCSEGPLEISGKEISETLEIIHRLSSGLKGVVGYVVMNNAALSRLL